MEGVIDLLCFPFIRPEERLQLRGAEQGSHVSLQIGMYKLPLSLTAQHCFDLEQLSFDLEL